MAKIVEVKAFISRDKDPLYKKSWLNETEIANPMSIYEEYKAKRSSWGKNSLSRFLTEVTTDDGFVGYGIGIGGEAGCVIVEKHLKRFLLGSDPRDIERIWDQMCRSTAHYGQGAIHMSAIASLDLALWDLCGKLRGEPVYKILGGGTKPTIPVYGTGPDPEKIQKLGFKGAKLPLRYGPADGEEGMKKNIAIIAEARQKVGPDYELMLDCYMALTVPYVIELVRRIEPYHIRWIEDFLLPADYEDYIKIKPATQPILIATGEHEFTRNGFRYLISHKAVDILQLDLTWMGGVTEARRIAGMANLYHIPVIPHAQSIFSYHFVMSQSNCPMAEYAMAGSDGDQIEPFFGEFFMCEPLPSNGVVTLQEKPGWGVELKPDLDLIRPYIDK
ncbi:MAG: L-rhamnonate dehydratase [Thermodesulfobacteriota bacterium]